MRASDKPTKLNTASDTRFMSRSVLECDENRQYQENSKKMKALRPIVLTSFLFLIVLAGAWQTRAQDRKARYPGMTSLDQYLMERDAEVILARSAAPQSISHDADVMVLGRHGYETAVKGKNGFVCMVERSWSAGFDDPDFWNPKVRAPICFNAPAARYNLPLTIKRTGLILSGQSKAQISKAIEAAFDTKQLPALESSAMCYMMSKQGYLSDSNGHWHPHLMFFTPLTEPIAWGAGLPGSPVIGARHAEERMTVFLVPVSQWSDGTAAPAHDH
jgi:hypothetical protein